MTKHLNNNVPKRLYFSLPNINLTCGRLQAKYIYRKNLCQYQRKLL